MPARESCCSRCHDMVCYVQTFDMNVKVAFKHSIFRFSGKVLTSKAEFFLHPGEISECISLHGCPYISGFP